MAGWKRLSRHGAFQKGVSLLRTKNEIMRTLQAEQTILLTDRESQLLEHWFSSREELMPFMGY